MERVFRSIGGTLYYCGGVLLVYQCVGSFYFVVFYILYPMIEGNILLAAVNYTWHAFIDPQDHDNDYVNSVTILNGLNFTLSEEYHVVHHQVRAMLWSVLCRVVSFQSNAVPITHDMHIPVCVDLLSSCVDIEDHTDRSLPACLSVTAIAHTYIHSQKRYTHTPDEL